MDPGKVFWEIYDLNTKDLSENRKILMNSSKLSHDAFDILA